MAKKVIPTKKFAPVSSAPKKMAPKKMAPKKAVTASVKKAAPKVAAKAPVVKAPLKVPAKKDVKTPVPQPMAKVSGAKKMSKPADAPKTDAAKKGIELKVKAAAAMNAPASGKPLTKPPKAAKAPKKASAPKNYDNMCREIACESSSSTAGYCRLHYIKNWKKIKRKELILREKKLNQYIEELVSKYPDKYIEAIKQDLADETAFSKVIYDLELDDSVDDIPADDEADEQVIDSIKREFDDGDTDF